MAIGECLPNYENRPLCPIQPSHELNFEPSLSGDRRLIVLDELGEYLRKVQRMDGRDQLTAFTEALFTAVETTSNADLR